MELVQLKVDVIVTTTVPAVRAAKQATTVIPIVIGGVDDAVEQGFVTSLAKPGGNITGTSWLNAELSGKRLDLLKQALPAITRIGVLREAVGGGASARAVMIAAQSLGVQAYILELRAPNELDDAFSDLVRMEVGGLNVLQSPMITSETSRIAYLASHHRLPAIFPDRRFIEAGGLMSYGPNLPTMYRRAATYVDRILKGAKLGFGIGIAQGYTTLGQIGFEGRFDYAAIGSFPNLAARLCGKAKNGQILISQRVRVEVGDVAEIEPLGERISRASTGPYLRSTCVS